MVTNLLRKFLSLGSFGASVFLHVAIFFMVSGWVLIQAVTPKVIPIGVDAADTTFQLTELPPEIPDDDLVTPVMDNAEVTEAQVQTTGMPTDMITTAATNRSFTIPATVGMYMPGATVAVGQAPAGQGKKATNPSGKIVIGNLFGAKVESAQLGVLLDISGSAHKYLPLVIEELNKKFGNAIIILVYGGGMDESVTADQAPVLPYAEAKLDPTYDGVGKRSTLQQIALAEKASPEVAKIFKRLKSRRNVFYVYSNNPGATQYAFEALLEKGADAIYWFSDFEDSISPKLGKQILGAVKVGHTKVIAHNFSGRNLTGDEPGAVSLRYGKKLAEETGGELIIVVPNKK
jgi:hypothetical protein